MTDLQFDFSHGDFRVVLTRGDGQRANTDSEALENHDDGNWGDYLIAPAAQLGTSRTWLIPIPSWLPAGTYTARVYAGTSPALTAEEEGSGTFEWDGSAIVLMAAALEATQTAKVLPLKAPLSPQEINALAAAIVEAME